MSSVIHPVGPEPSEKYWVRRAIVVGVALVLVIVLMVALFNRNAGQQPAPAAPPAGSTSESSPTSSPTVSESAAPSVSTTASTSAPPSSKGSSASSPSATSSSTASGTASSKASATAKSSSSVAPTASGRASSSASASGSASGTPTATASASPTATPTTAADQQSLVICDPAKLRPTITAPSRSVKAKKSLAFSMSLINGSTGTCVVTLKPTDFELKIYSGKDRIWSTNDCAKLVDPKLAEIKPQQSISWKITWDGRRSAKSCGTPASIPRAGTYWATAQFTGSKPVQFRFLVK